MLYLWVANLDAQPFSVRLPPELISLADTIYIQNNQPSTLIAKCVVQDTTTTITSKMMVEGNTNFPIYAYFSFHPRNAKKGFRQKTANFWLDNQAQSLVFSKNGYEIIGSRTGDLCREWQQQVLIDPNHFEDSLVFYQNKRQDLRKLNAPIAEQWTCFAKIAFFNEQKNDWLWKEMEAFLSKSPSVNLMGWIAESSLQSFNLGQKTAFLSLFLPEEVAQSDWMLTYKSKQQIENKVIGKSLYDHSVPILSDNQGEKIRWEDYKGKILLVDFCASWCTPCVIKHAEWRKVYPFLQEKGVEIISIDFDEDLEKPTYKSFVKNIPWRQVHSEQRLLEQRFAQYFGISYLPFYFLVNPEGVIEARNEDIEKMMGRIAWDLQR